MLKRLSLLVLLAVVGLFALGMTINGSRTILGTLDFSGSTGIIRLPYGTTPPATCTVGDYFTDTDADTDGSLLYCYTTNNWKEVDDDGAAGGTPGGAVGDVQYNDGGGGFAAEAAFDYDAATNFLTVDNITSLDSLVTNTPTTLSAAELDRLDAKDAALVDTNDAVATAITGTGTVTAGTWQSDLYNVAGNVTLADAGKCGIDTATDQFACHFGASGEITGEAVIPALQVVSVVWSPSNWYSTDAQLFIMTVGDEAPNGISIVEWSLSCESSSNAVAGELEYYSAFIGAGGGTQTANIDTIDTASGISAEDTEGNINGGVAIPNGSRIYLDIDATPTCVQAIFQMWYFIEED